MSLTTFRKTGSASLPCDPSVAYEILIDYDGYSEWLPWLAASKLLAKEGDLAIAEFELGFGAREKYAVECIHTRNRMVLTRTISGRVPVRQFEWLLEPSGAGGCKVVLNLEGRNSWQRFVPAYGCLIRPAACLKRLELQAASYSTDLAVQDASGERLFELMETEQGMVCTYRGKKYTLTPLDGGGK